jgi:hypothetical protein
MVNSKSGECRRKEFKNGLEEQDILILTTTETITGKGHSEREDLNAFIWKRQKRIL